MPGVLWQVLPGMTVEKTPVRLLLVAAGRTRSVRLASPVRQNKERAQRALFLGGIIRVALFARPSPCGLRALAWPAYSFPTLPDGRCGSNPEGATRQPCPAEYKKGPAGPFYILAEREGFEPSIGVTYTPLAGERLQPLGHLSAGGRILQRIR